MVSICARVSRFGLARTPAARHGARRDGHPVSALSHAIQYLT